jgi:hypothetical protein
MGIKMFSHHGHSHGGPGHGHKYSIGHKHNNVHTDSEAAERKEEGSDFDSKVGAGASWLMSFSGQTALLNDIVSFILLDMAKLSACFAVTLSAFVTALALALIIASFDTWFHLIENKIGQDQIYKDINQKLKDEQLTSTDHIRLSNLDHLLLWSHRTDDVLGVAGVPAGFMEVISSVFNITIDLNLKLGLSFIALIIGVIGSRSSQRNGTIILQRNAFFKQGKAAFDVNNNTATTLPSEARTLATV